MRPRGTTLVEVLVAMVVALVLLTGILGFAVSGMRLWHLGADKVEVDESALVTIKAVTDLLRGSDITSVFINPGGVTSGVSFLSGVYNGHLDYVVSTPPAKGSRGGTFSCSPPCLGCSTCGPAPAASAPNYANDARIIWHAWQVIYLDPSTRCVRLGTVPLAQPGISPTPYRLDHYTPTPQDHLIAANVDQLQLSSVPFNPPGSVSNASPTTNPIYVQVQASKPTVPQPAVMTSAVYLDNGFVQGVNTGDAACP